MYRLCANFQIVEPFFSYWNPVEINELISRFFKKSHKETAVDAQCLPFGIVRALFNNETHANSPQLNRDFDVPQMDYARSLQLVQAIQANMQLTVDQHALAYKYGRAV
jgi:hypothetical protein